MSDIVLLDTFVRYAKLFNVDSNLATKILAHMRITNVEKDFHAVLAAMLTTPEHLFFLINEFLAKKTRFHIFNPRFKYPLHPNEFQILNARGFFVCDYDDRLEYNMIRGFMHCQTLLAIVSQLPLEVKITANHRPFLLLPSLPKELKYRLTVNYIFLDITAPLHWRPVYQILYQAVSNANIVYIPDPPVEEVKAHIARYPNFDDHLYEINSVSKILRK